MDKCGRGRRKTKKQKPFVQVCLDKARLARSKCDYATAMEWYLCASQKGSGEAMGAIGSFYLGGLGVEQNFAMAHEWLSKGASKKDGQALAHLGKMYIDGLGVLQNEQKAFECFLQSADKNNMDGLLGAIRCLQKGIGTQVDETKAYFYCHKAAVLGNDWAQNEIGIAYYLGRFGKIYKCENDKAGQPDYLYAEFWFDKSAGQGNADAMCNLATMYQNGFGRKKHVDEMLNLFTFDDRPVGQPNCQMALYWYQKAVEHGSESAKQKLATLQSQMKQHN